MSQTLAAPDLQRSDWSPEPMTQRVVVRCFANYADAKRAVDQLRVARIPERKITVMGRDMTFKPVLTAERSARLGGTLGAVVSGATALLLWSLGALVDEFSWLSALVAGGFIGAAVGVAVALAAWRIGRHRGGLREAANVDVGRFDVLVENGDAARARSLLGG